MYKPFPTAAFLGALRRSGWAPGSVPDSVVFSIWRRWTRSPSGSPAWLRTRPAGTSPLRRG